MAEVGRYFYNKSDGKGGYSQHAKVGCYLPNAWGLYDMHGNVWEWCLDWYGSYGTSAVTDPVGAATGTYRLMRGFGWTSYAYGCRSANRSYFSMWTQSNSRGFRVAARSAAWHLSAGWNMVFFDEQPGEEFAERLLRRADAVMALAEDGESYLHVTDGLVAGVLYWVRVVEPLVFALPDAGGAVPMPFEPGRWVPYGSSTGEVLEGAELFKWSEKAFRRCDGEATSPWRGYFLRLP